MEYFNILVKIAILSIIVIKKGRAKNYRKNKAGLQSIPDITYGAYIHVELKENLITSIQAHDLQNVPKILNLDLEDNKISSISPDAFKNNTRLKTIDLANNPLKNFPFFQNGVVENLELGDCLITNDTWDMIVPYSRLRKLNLNNNDIKHIPDLNMSKGTITELKLENCGIADIRPGHFKGYNKLESLHLQNNQFVTLQDYIFVGLDSLENLVLDRNRLLTKTGWFTFSGLRKLNRLLMNDGEALKTFPCVGIFSPNITELNVGQNKIENCPANCSSFIVQKLLFHIY